MNHFTLHIDNLRSEHDVELVTFRTKKVSAHCKVHPNLNQKKVTVFCEKDDVSAEIIINALSNIGFQASVKAEEIEDSQKTIIRSRKEVQELIYLFYEKVRRDDLLGPIFNKAIPEGKWHEHLEKMIDFWEMNLFYVPKYTGNPPKAHIDLDKSFNSTINQNHFERWLMLWGETLDYYFDGTLTIDARKRANNIANVLLTKILIARGEYQAVKP